MKDHSFFWQSIWRLATLAILAALIIGCGSTGATSGGTSLTSQPTGPLSASALSVQFGNVPVGTAVTQVLTFTSSTGNPSNITVSAVQVSGAGFSLTQQPTLPLVIAPGQSASITVQALPSAAGAMSGTITITSNATPSTVTINLSATGVTTTGTTFGISGTLSPAAQVAGATVTLTGNGLSPSVVTADSNGNYTFAGLTSGSYTVTPTKSGVVFNPASQAITVNAANVSGVNFTESFAISGSLSATGSGATVAMSGTATQQVTADANGNFTFNGLGNGTYTITPSKTGYSFSPTSQQITVNNAVVNGVNFTVSQGQLSINPSSFTFTNITAGTTSQPQSATLNAVGGDVTITSDSLSGTGFGFSGVTFPVTISSGKNASFSVTFSPAAAGNSTGTLAFNNGSTILASASLSGTSSGLAVSSSNLSFGPVVDSTSSAPQTLTLSAIGSAITVTSANLTQSGGGGSAFSVSGMPATPFTIASGQTAQMTVSFAPAVGSPGTASGTLAFASSANGASVTLGGTGVSNVLLSWTASTTPSVTYNVYRCSISAAACVQSQPGNFTQVSNGISQLSYVDGSVSSGQTYYYALTAVDTSNNEGTLSTVAAPAVIP